MRVGDMTLAQCSPTAVMPVERVLPSLEHVEEGPSGWAHDLERFEPFLVTAEICERSSISGSVGADELQNLPVQSRSRSVGVKI